MKQVYFIRAGKGGPVKIGYTTNLKRRFLDIGQGIPDEPILEATLPGGRELELKLHQALAEHRRRNEWFNPTQEVNGVVVLAAKHGLAPVIRWMDRKSAEVIVRDCPFEDTDDFESDLRSLAAFGFRTAVERHGYPAVCEAVGRTYDAVNKYVRGKSNPPITQVLELIRLDPGCMAPFMARCGDVPEFMQSTPYLKASEA